MNIKEWFNLLNTYKRINLEYQLNSPYCCKPVDQKKCQLNIYFGLPGSGKSTYAAYLAAHDMKKGRAVYSNFPITGAFILEPKDDLGSVEVVNGRVIIDECSVEFNNRDFKNMEKRIIEFLKYHRHNETIVDVFSQAPDDIDITFRRLAYNCYWIRKTMFPWLISITPIERTIDVIEGDLKTTYEIHKSLFQRKFVYCPPYWKLFNTLSRKQLPRKEWKRY